MRDLDDLLDPVVGRRAAKTARTPEFAAVQRRGIQRRRRAQAMAVGAVVAAAAAVGIVGTQIAADRSDTAPAVPPGYDDPNGRLARIVESGRATIDAGVTVGADGSVLTVWGRIPSGDAPNRPMRRGFTLAIEGETYWSPLAYHHVQVAKLADGSNYLVAATETAADTLPTYYLAAADGLRRVDLATEPIDPERGEYEGFAALRTSSQPAGAVYTIDTETASASPVRQLVGVVPDTRTTRHDVAQSGDGGIWMVDFSTDPVELLNLTPDGRVASYPLPAELQGAGMRNRLDLSVSPDGRPVLLWALRDDKVTGEQQVNALVLRLSTVDESGILPPTELARLDATDVPRVGSLPDGRVLINAGERLLASTDPTWREFVEVAGPAAIPRDVLRGYRMASGDGSACLTPTADVGAYLFTRHAESDVYCTTDGESWEPFKLTP